jgi:hypothetical protein
MSGFSYETAKRRGDAAADFGASQQICTRLTQIKL